MSGIQNLVDIKDIGKFEHQNNISVDVYACEDRKIFLLRITTVTVARHHMNLLLILLLIYITAGEKSNLSRLVSRQYSNDNNKRYFCEYCLDARTSEEVLKNHMKRCKLPWVQRIKLPEVSNKKGGNKVKFTKTKYQLPLHFVISADFESVLCKQGLCESSSSKSSTSQDHHQVQCGSCIYVKCSDGHTLNQPK